MKRYVRALALAGFCAAFIAHAQAPEVVTTFASGASSGGYAFASWTPKTLGDLLQGQDYADKIGKAGTPVEFVAMEGAHHKFDRDDQKRYYLRAVTRTKADCPLELDIDTLYAYDRTNGARVQGDAYTAMLKSCTAIGATAEGSNRAREKAAQAAVGFLKKTFAH